MSENLLKVATILKPHGYKGIVKVESLIEEGLEGISDVLVGERLEPAKVLSSSRLNKDFYIFNLSNIGSIEEAEKSRNKSIYIDRSKYSQFEDKIYMSDLMNKALLDENGNTLGVVADYDDYGASMILTVKCGAVSYQIPYVDDIVRFDRVQDAFVTNKNVFEDVRV